MDSILVFLLALVAVSVAVILVDRKVALHFISAFVRQIGPPLAFAPWAHAVINLVRSSAKWRWSAYAISIVAFVEITSAIDFDIAPIIALLLAGSLIALAACIVNYDYLRTALSVTATAVCAAVARAVSTSTSTGSMAFALNDVSLEIRQVAGRWYAEASSLVPAIITSFATAIAIAGLAFAPVPFTIAVVVVALAYASLVVTHRRDARRLVSALR